MTGTSSPERHPAAGWCWFHWPRAVSWQRGTALGIVSPVTGSRSGHVAVALARGDRTEVIHLEEVDGLDDHNAPALVVVGDELLALWTGHDADTLIRMARVRDTPAGLSVTRLPPVDLGWRVTYVSILSVDEHVVRLVTRARRRGQVVVDIDRATGRARRLALLLWHTPTAADPWYSGRDGGRPYVVYRPDPREAGRTWFAATDDHPRAYRSGLWTGFLDGDAVCDADGRPVRQLLWQDPAGALPTPAEDAFLGLTAVTPRGDKRIPWVHDLAVSEHGRPVVAASYRWVGETEFRAGRDDESGERSYLVAERTAGGHWRLHDLGPAGSALGRDEADYVGGIALDPNDPGLAVLSTDAGPAGAPRQESHRLFVVDLHGDEPRFLRLGDDAEPAAIRPTISTLTDGGHALAYLTGTYRHYSDFDLTAHVLPFEPSRSCWGGEEGHVDLPFGIGPDDALPAPVMGELHEHLRRSTAYLEYGAGSSTLAALRHPGLAVTSVESDRTLVRAVRAAARGIGGAAERLDARDRGWPVSREWGYPMAGDPIEQGRRYVEGADDVDPDLVLIDGRFRVACFLHTISRLRRPAVILWDDYRWRRHYHVVEAYVRPERTVDRLAVFALPGPIVVDRSDYDASLGLPG